MRGFREHVACSGAITRRHHGFTWRVRKTERIKLSPVYSAETPFGDIPNVDANFTFAGDLRQTVLDCLVRFVAAKYAVARASPSAELHWPDD